MKPVVLIVDDEKNTREGLRRTFEEDYDILLAEDGNRGLEILKEKHVDVVLTDLRMPGLDGMTFTRRASILPRPPLIIVMTAYGSVQTAVEAMKVGAYDYLTKPVNLDNLEMMINRGLESRRLRSENETLRSQLDEKYGLENMIGNSSCMVEVFETIRQVAPARTTVLIGGESGTGKELAARALHQLSPRSGKPFIAVHCASLNANLLESELFGHEKGAFTGATERQIGRFEKADGGTLFLDEIGEIDASTQVKLLRVLETQTFERVGGSKPIEVDVRVITATNRELKQMVDEKEFREDLYYRLNVVTVGLPPLRDRSDDLPLLLKHFVSHFSDENGKKLKGITPEAMKVLSAYNWPGNVRELRNCVERMVVMARGDTLTLGDVPADVRSSVADSLDSPEENPTSGLNIDNNERNLIIRALRENNGNRTRAANMLGISRRTLHRKLHTYGLEAL